METAHELTFRSRSPFQCDPNGGTVLWAPAMTLNAKRVVSFVATAAVGMAVLFYFDRDIDDRNVMLFVLGVAAVLSLLESALRARSNHDAKR